MKLELPISLDNVKHFEKLVDAKAPVVPVLVSAQFGDGTRMDYHAYPLHIKIGHGFQCAPEAVLVLEVARDRIPAEIPQVQTDTQATIAKLEAENAKMRRVLGEIKAVRYGLDPSDSDEERAQYWSNLALGYRDLASRTLKELSPA